MSEKKSDAPPPYRRQRYLCTAGEWRFCQKLEEAVGDRFTIMMQVRVGALLTVDDRHWKRWGRKVAQKSFDFALVKKGSSYVAAVVELDDKTHQKPDRRERDAFLDVICSQTDLPLIRFQVTREYDVDAIRELVDQHLASPPPKPSSKRARKPWWLLRKR